MIWLLFSTGQLLRGDLHIGRALPAFGALQVARVRQEVEWAPIQQQHSQGP